MSTSETGSTLAARGRLVWRALAIGATVGIVGTIALAPLLDARIASRKVFAVGALVLGFGLLSWSGSIMAGDGFGAMQHHLDVRTDWTERKSRRAMARVGGFGAGLMVGAAVVSAIVA